MSDHRVCVRQDWRSCRWIGVLLVLTFSVTESRSESAIDLLSGFDEHRVAECFPVESSETAGEMSKLLFRLRKMNEKLIESRAASVGDDLGDYVHPGDVVPLSGTITAIRQYKVPESQIEFLELETFQEIVLALDQSDASVSLFAPPLVGKISKGDQVAANAIVVSNDEAERCYAAGRVAWIPAHADRVGWKLLARQGVDLSRIAEAASRNRRVLLAADSEAFYTMIAAANQLDTAPLDPGGGVPMPLEIKPVTLLKTPGDFHGQWIRIKAATVRVTRVNVTDLGRRRQLGQNHYYQIDASGDLGKTIVQLERGEGDEGEPIRMSGSYPVSFVAAELPEFLTHQMKEPGAVVSMVSHPVEVEGFFYRLWSYKNEFMEREGGGKQVGPLIMVSSWKSMERPPSADDGVEVIGYVLAAGILSAIVGTFFWTRRNTKEDAQIRDSQQTAATIDL